MVFVGIIGLSFTGKRIVANILKEYHGFQYLEIDYCCSTSPESGSLLNGVDNLHVNDDISNGAMAYQVKFKSAEELIDFVLKNYNQNFVTIVGGLNNQFLDTEYHLYSARPSYVSLAIDSSYQLRIKRAILNGLTELKFLNEETILPSKIFKISDTIVENNCIGEHDQVGLLALRERLSEMLPTFSNIARPGWDNYFMQLAELASHRSNCMKRRVGCVLVTSITHRILATGYNGTPLGIRNCNEGGCPRCNSNCGSGVDLASCICIHAEENVLLEVGRERIHKHFKSLSDTKVDTTILFCTHCPCIGCCKKIIQCGIKEVVYMENYYYNKQVMELFEMANIKCRQFNYLHY